MTDIDNATAGAEPPKGYGTPAIRAFAALTTDQRELLLSRIFEILEYDKEGEPGGEWSNETTQDIGEAFGAFGITFTSPDDVTRCRFCGRWLAPHGASWRDRAGSLHCEDNVDGCGACKDGEAHPHAPETAEQPAGPIAQHMLSR